MHYFFFGTSFSGCSCCCTQNVSYFYVLLHGFSNTFFTCFYILHVVLQVYKHIQAQIGNSGHIYSLYHCWKDSNFFVEVCNLINITDWLVLLFICQGFRDMEFEDPLHIYLFRILICFTGYWLTLHKKWSFPLRISSANILIPQETGDLVTFTEEILNRKLHFLCSVTPKIQILRPFKVVQNIKSSWHILI